MKISELLLTVYFSFLTIISLSVTFIICMISYPFVKQKTFSRFYEIIPAYILLHAMTIPRFWTLKIVDLRKDKKWDKNFMIVANHTSFIDSLIIAKAIPIKKKFMIAQIFTKIPIFGTLSKLSGHVTADRNNPLLNKDAVERAIKTIKHDNSSFCIFPEGLRELKPYTFEKFKTGAYRISHETKLPILPVTIKGAYEAMRFKAIVGFSNIVITIDEPFLVESDDYETYIEKTKKLMESHLKM